VDDTNYLCERLYLNLNTLPFGTNGTLLPWGRRNAWLRRTRSRSHQPSVMMSIGRKSSAFSTRLTANLCSYTVRVMDVSRPTLQLHPYVFAGIGPRFWVKYTLQGERASISRWLRGRESLLIVGATIEHRPVLGGIFGLGHIVIRNENSEILWYNVRSAKQVAAKLELASSGLPIHGTTTTSADASQTEHSASTLVTELSDSQTERSKALFMEAVTACLPPPSVKKATPLSMNETWTVDYDEWDASHAVPKRGDGKRINNPTLIAWSPDGTELVTACNARTFTRWSVDGARIGGNGAYDHASPAIRFCWSPDGNLVLLEGVNLAGLNRWWTIQDRRGEVLWKVKQLGTLGFDNSASSNLERTEYRNPWRPWRAQLLVSRGESHLDLLNVLETIDSPVASLDFSRLDDRDRRILRYHWHPSGEFLAVTVCDPSNEHLTRHVRIIHLGRGEIVASIPSISTGMGWSPDGQSLLFSMWTAPYTDNWQRETAMWDSGRWSHRELTEGEHDLVWVRRLHNNDLQNDHETLNADGSIVLRYGKLLHSQAWGQRVESASDCEVIRELPRYEHAAWSPTDPHCFATVGGDNNSSRMVRIWRLVRDATDAEIERRH
jgi:WD40-like Beta Propeller Repeat